MEFFRYSSFWFISWCLRLHLLFNGIASHLTAVPFINPTISFKFLSRLILQPRPSFP